MASSFTRFLDHIQTYHIRQESSGLVICSSQRRLPDNTQHSLETDRHAPGGIRTYNLSRQAAADLRLRQHGHWDRRCGTYGDITPFERTHHWARFSSNIQTGPGAHLASCTMSTASFPRVKRPGRGVGHPPPSSADVTERVELYLYSPSGPSWPDLG
jgi:hypothetical protein